MIFYERPADFKPWFEVAGCLCECEGKILLLKRLTGKSAGDLWGAPGGKIDTGETVSQALIRELREETGIFIQEAESVHTKTFYVRANAQKDFVYHLYRAQFSLVPEVTLNPLEHTEFKWVTPAEALTMPLVQDMEECVRSAYKM